jgi:hypothetical protein
MARGKRKAAVFEVLPPGNTEVSVALTADEKKELTRFERVIKGGWETFVEVGKALAAIQQQRLYRGKYRSFEAYCRDRWQYGKSHAHRLIGAAEVIDHLSPIGDGLPLPLNESQVRPLIGLEAEDQVKAWKAAVEQAAGKGITAKMVRLAAEGLAGTKGKSHAKSPKRKTPLTTAALEAVDAALSSLAEKDLERATSTLEELRELLAKS